MKKLRKIISFVLSIVLVIYILPFFSTNHAFASNVLTNTIIGKWSGVYESPENDGKTYKRYVDLTVLSYIKGVFCGIFEYSIPDFQNGLYGSYYLEGTLNENTNSFSFCGKRMIIDDGYYSHSYFSTYSGSIDFDNEAMDSYLGTTIHFTLHRTINDNETYKNVIGSYIGTHFGSENGTNILRNSIIDIQTCTPEGLISGRFIIYPIEGNEHQINGIYRFAGFIDFTSGFISFEGKEWIQFPDIGDDYIFQEYNGFMNVQDGKIVGNNGNGDFSYQRGYIDNNGNIVLESNYGHLYDDCNVIEGIETEFKESWFEDNSYYNHDLARLCSEMVVAGYNAEDHPYDLYKPLEELGFSDWQYDMDTGRDEQNYFIASRTIRKAGKDYNLVFCGCIGSHGKQWNSDFDPWGVGSSIVGHDTSSLNHKGFIDAKNYIRENLSDYFNENNYDKDNTILLLTGHSRGAAAANLLAAEIIDKGSFASSDNLFTYTFATPNCTGDTNISNPKYNIINNIVFPTDFVTKVMPKKWGYGRYGKTYSLPTKTNDVLYEEYKEKMLDYYKLLRNENEDFADYSSGEETVWSIINEMSNTVENVESFYSNKNTLGVFYSKKLEISPFDYFQKGLCPFVNGVDDENTALFETLIPSILESGTLLQRVSLFFLINAYSRDDLMDKIDSFLDSLNEGYTWVKVIYMAFTLDVGTPIATDIALAKTIETAKSVIYEVGTPIEPRFHCAHYPETYCAFMLAMNSDEVTTYRKGYNGSVNCPVDIEITEKDSGEVVGRIVNNTVDEEIAAKPNSVVMTVDGDEKEFWLPGNGEYDVRLIGNDNGVMDYTVREIDPDTGETNRVNYYDVPVEKDKAYTDFFTSEKAFVITAESGSELTPDEAFNSENEVTYSVTVTAEGSGTASDSLTVPSGDYVTLVASPVKSEFLGWYQNDTLVSTDLEYRFRPTEDISLTAKFTGEDLKPVEFGDVDVDGEVTISDATQIQMYLAELVELEDVQVLLSDYNLDGSVDISDATQIQLKLAELI